MTLQNYCWFYKTQKTITVSSLMFLAV